MLPPRLVRRLILAPLAVVIAVAVAALFPLLALLAGVFGLVGRARPGRMRGLRLLFFALVWFTAETVTLFVCLGLWMASGFGGGCGPSRSRIATTRSWAGSCAWCTGPRPARSQSLWKWRSRISPTPSGQPGSPGR